MNLSLRPGRLEDQLVAAVAGDVDLYVSVSLADSLLQQLDAGKRRLVIDVGEVGYLDSSGVGVLIRTLQKARSVGGDVSIARLGGTPRKVLEMNNLLLLFKTYPDVDSALLAWN